jgi:hypothetical protein
VTGIEVDPQDPKSVKVGSTHWRLWQSDDQHYYATRGGITRAQEDAGYKATIVADTPGERQELLLAHSDPLTSED